MPSSAQQHPQRWPAESNWNPGWLIVLSHTSRRERATERDSGNSHWLPLPTVAPGRTAGALRIASFVLHILSRTAFATRLASQALVKGRKAAQERFSEEASGSVPPETCFSNSTVDSADLRGTYGTQQAWVNSRNQSNIATRPKHRQLIFSHLTSTAGKAHQVQPQVARFPGPITIGFYKTGVRNFARSESQTAEGDCRRMAWRIPRKPRSGFRQEAPARRGSPLRFPDRLNLPNRARFSKLPLFHFIGLRARELNARRERVHGEFALSFLAVRGICKCFVTHSSRVRRPQADRVFPTSGQNYAESIGRLFDASRVHYHPDGKRHQ